MIVEETYTFPAPPAAIWEMLLDPAIIARTMPGASEMVRVTHDRYTGKLRFGIGSFTAVEFQIAVVLADVVAPEHYTMLVDGQGKLGFTRGTAQMRLAPDGAGTELRFRAEMQVGGAIAGVGQHLVDALGRRLTKQGLDALAREVNRRLLGRATS